MNRLNFFSIFLVNETKGLDENRIITCNTEFINCN